MSVSKVHRVSDKMNFTRHYRKFNYNEIAEILKTGETAFFESTSAQPLKRQTVWKAAKKLSSIVGKKVVAVYGDMKLNGDKEPMKGYLFSTVENKKKTHC
jgi:hypothetical protein